MIYLASTSPRRRELLTQIGLTFELLAVEVDESVIAGESPESYVVRVAELKARQASQLAVQPWPVLAADTIVISEGRILAKPRDQADAVAMLQQLSGKTHQVKTAIAVASGEQISSEVVSTDVTFRSLSLAEIEAYWQTGEPVDKAGGYGIQGIAGKFVAKLVGSYSAVVGLPLMETERLLQGFIGKVEYER